MRDLPIRGESIRLGQALKLSGLAESGGEARALVEDGVVTVNDTIETRRGRQLRDGDVVVVGDDALRIEASGPASTSTPISSPPGTCSTSCAPRRSRWT